MIFETRKKKILVVGMGGTISSIAAADGALMPALSLAELFELPFGDKDAPELELVPLENKDSSRARPEDWLALGSLLRDRLHGDGDICGAVVTHGTDTMEEAVYFIDRTLQSTHPVCFSGSLRGASHRSPDGLGNLSDALAVAGDPQSQGVGAVLVLDSCIYPARGLRKVSTQSLDAFRCLDPGCLGRVIGGQPHWMRRPARPPAFSIASPLPRVDLIVEYPGNDGTHLRASAQAGACGLVVQALGAGNVGEGLFEAILEARGAGIPVVISTRVDDGWVVPLYGGPGGGHELAKAGCLFARGFTPPQARIELMLALAAGSPHAALASLFAGKSMDCNTASN